MVGTDQDFQSPLNSSWRNKPIRGEKTESGFGLSGSLQERKWEGGVEKT